MVTVTKINPSAPDDLADRIFTPIGGEAANEASAEQEQPPKMSNAQILAGGLSAGRDVFCAVTKLQSPKRVLDDSKTKTIADLWAPVLDKYGFDLGAYLGDYALELTAVIGTIAIVSEVRQAVIAEIAQREREQTVTENKPQEFSDAAS